ncbi:type IV pilin protein [Aquabacterium sp.]|uniref:type IV pilin protein n=1 Tax=Aquabacterium sp. TaxID=1872578 RepID=UPI002C6E5FD1|nr:type IV pilin protein [Aquabacterium sp.]HSW07909.1 type IV pilin protein [Aquabacterium sp.]
MRHPVRPLRRVIGVTLIELLVAVAIAAILGAIAYPAFMQSIYKGRRADASAGLIRVQQAMERWRSNHSAYTDSAADLNTSLSSPDGHYTLVITLANSGTAYLIKATAVGVQASDTQCKFLTVAMSGTDLVYSSSSDGTSFVSSPNNPCWAR